MGNHIDQDSHLQIASPVRIIGAAWVGLDGGVCRLLDQCPGNGVEPNG